MKVFQPAHRKMFDLSALWGVRGPNKKKHRPLSGFCLLPKQETSAPEKCLAFFFSRVVAPFPTWFWKIVPPPIDPPEYWETGQNNKRPQSKCTSPPGPMKQLVPTAVKLIGIPSLSMECNPPDMRPPTAEGADGGSPWSPITRVFCIT